MARIRCYYRDQNGKRVVKTYDPERSALICRTPYGPLYKKKAGALEFFLYHPEGKTNKDKITSVPWDKAQELVRTYGTLETYNHFFKTTGKKHHTVRQFHFSVNLDETYAVKAQRNASIRGMNVHQFIRHIIDLYDMTKEFSRKPHSKDKTITLTKE